MSFVIGFLFGMIFLAAAIGFAEDWDLEDPLEDFHLGDWPREPRLR